MRDTVRPENCCLWGNRLSGLLPFYIFYSDSYPLRGRSFFISVLCKVGRGNSRTLMALCFFFCFIYKFFCNDWVTQTLPYVCYYASTVFLKLKNILLENFVKALFRKYLLLLLSILQNKTIKVFMKINLCILNKKLNSHFKVQTFKFYKAFSRITNIT